MSAAGNIGRTAVGVDPGRSKCGIAVVRAGNPPTTLATKVVVTENLLVSLAEVLRTFSDVDTLVIGNGTQSRTLYNAIAAMFPTLPIAVVDEHGSSRRARLSYLAQNPPRGWRRLVPQGLRSPDRPYDDVVADLLARDFLIGAAKILQQSP